MKTYTQEKLSRILAEHAKWSRREGGNRANLRDADLSGADLRDAYLRGAYLRDAYLSGADLRGADLSDADLRDAYLSGADLRDADLRGAYLRDADLSGADLRGADLSDADLRDAYLSDADLSDADLRDADLRGAYLRGADLSGAYLRGADLSGAYLRDADLSEIKEDVLSVLVAAPDEVLFLLNALRAGKVDGSVYEGQCACLVGTLANARGCNYNEIPGLTPDSDRMAEKWFMGIRKGDTPVNNPISAVTADWVEHWLKENRPDLARVSGSKVDVELDGKKYTATID